ASAVIGVDRARRIEHRHAVVQCEPRARPDLALDPGGERESEPGRVGLTRPAARSCSIALVTYRSKPLAASSLHCCQDAVACTAQGSTRVLARNRASACGPRAMALGQKQVVDEKLCSAETKG